MRTWGNFRRTRPRIVKGTRDSGTDLLTKQSCRSAGLLVFGERPKPTEGRGRKIPWIPAGQCKGAVASCSWGWGWGVSADDTEAHPGVTAASPHPDEAPEACAEPAAEMGRGRGETGETWKGEGRPETGPAGLR